MTNEIAPLCIINNMVVIEMLFSPAHTQIFQPVLRTIEMPPVNIGLTLLSACGYMRA